MQRLDITLLDGADFSVELSAETMPNVAYSAEIYDRWGVKVADMTVSDQGARVVLSLSKEQIAKMVQPCNIRMDEFSSFFGQWFASEQDNGTTTRIAEGLVYFAPKGRASCIY